MLRRLPATGRWLTVFALLSTVFGTNITSDAHDAPPPTRVGFTFRPHTAANMGLDPIPALRTLLDDLSPDIVRLPVYWSDAEPEPGEFNFSESDALIAAVAAHNGERNVRRTRVVLVVGMRNVGDPELFAPDWAIDVSGLDANGLAKFSDFWEYLTLSVNRYARNGLLDSWQVENEPLDSSVPLDVGDTDIPAEQLAAEVALVHRLDRIHRVMVTSFNSSTVDLDQAGIVAEETGVAPPPGAQPGGHPDQSLKAGDVLGLDLYVVYWGVNLADASVPTRIIWKRNALPFWVQRATSLGRQVWLAEMEASPYVGTDGFTTSDLLLSAREYSGWGINTALMWGVEAWLTQPDWMAAGLQAMALMRAA